MKPRTAVKRISAKRLAALGGKVPFSSIAPTEKVSGGKPYIRGGNQKRKAIPKVNVVKSAKRKAKNAEYYKSAEWRDVKKRTHEYDGYRCRCRVAAPRGVQFGDGPFYASGGYYEMRCPNRGENVNGKYTARGLTCDEINYQRRGDGSKGSGTHEPGITTRSLCKDCNARETVLKRANHAQGFNNRRGS